MNVEEIDTFLAHYGVKGMKWGVRRRSGNSKGKAFANKLLDKVGTKEFRKQLVGDAAILATTVILSEMNRKDSAGPKARPAKYSASKLGQRYDIDV